MRGLKQETWRTSHAKCGARSWLKKKKRNHARSQPSFPACTLILRLSGPEPSDLGRPPALASVYRVIQPRSVLHARRCPKRCPIWLLSSQARLPQEAPPPDQCAEEDPPRGGAETEGRAAEAPRHVHKGKLGARGSASPLPRWGAVGDAGVTRPGRTTTPDRLRGVIPHNFQIF